MIIVFFIQSYCCKICGNMLSPIVMPREDPTDINTEPKWVCKACPGGGEVVTIDIPQVFRYLIVELASCNMKIKLDLDG